MMIERNVTTILGWLWFAAALGIFYEMADLALHGGSWWKLPALVGVYLLAQRSYDTFART
jgi:hypothetical protein